MIRRATFGQHRFVFLGFAIYVLLFGFTLSKLSSSFMEDIHNEALRILLVGIALIVLSVGINSYFSVLHSSSKVTGGDNQQNFLMPSCLGILAMLLFKPNMSFLWRMSIDFLFFTFLGGLLHSHRTLNMSDKLLRLAWVILGAGTACLFHSSFLFLIIPIWVSCFFFFKKKTLAYVLCATLLFLSPMLIMAMVRWIISNDIFSALYRYLHFSFNRGISIEYWEIWQQFSDIQYGLFLLVSMITIWSYLFCSMNRNLGFIAIHMMMLSLLFDFLFSSISSSEQKWIAGMLLFVPFGFWTLKTRFYRLVILLLILLFVFFGLDFENLGSKI